MLPEVRNVPNNLIDMLSKQLELSEKTILCAKDIESHTITKFGDKDHIEIAAASVYIAAVFHNERRSQKQISALTKIHSTKLRCCYKKIAEHIDITLVL